MSLAATLRILQHSTQILADTASVLADTIEDIPRLQNVLQTKKEFAFVPEMDVAEAKKSMDTGLYPQLKLLGDTCDKKLQRLRRKKEALESQYQTLQSRLESAENRSPKRQKGEPEHDKSALARLRFLRSKNNRLRYTLKLRQTQSNRSSLSGVPLLPPA